MLLATAIEAAPFTILGDVPAVPTGAPWWAHYAALALPALGLWLFSSIVAEVNDKVRKMDAAGEPVAPKWRLAVSVLNRLAANHDKAREQTAKAAKGGES